MEQKGIFKMKNVLPLIFLSAYLAGFLNPLLAQEFEQVETSFSQKFDFQPAKMLYRAQPVYPNISIQLGREGSVVLSFMVDTTGKAYEIRVRHSSADSVIESSAITAVQQSTFSPALLNGEAVDSHQLSSYTFKLEEGFGARGAFYTEYKLFNVAIDEDNIEGARTFLRNMENSSSLRTRLYEQALYIYSAAQLANRDGDAYTHLKLSSHLPYFKNLGVGDMNPWQSYDVLFDAFNLQIQTGYYAEAINTFDLIKQHPYVPTSGLKQFQPIYEQLISIKNDDSAYSVEAKIDDQSYWDINLYKSTFYIDRVEGELDEIKLRCQAGYQAFPYSEEATYSLPESWGTCNLEVIGISDTTFYLTQQ